MSTNCKIIAIFPIDSQFGAIWKPDSGRIACKAYIFINSNLLSQKIENKTKKISSAILTLLFWVKVKLWAPWYEKVDFLKLHMGVLTYQISSF